MATLVTGFEPFGSATFNTSELVVRALSADPDPNVVTAVLPTSYHRAESRIADLLDEHRPRAVVLLGQSRTTRSIRLEQVAANLDDSRHPDNDGKVRRGRPILSEAPETYRSSLPLEFMAETARSFNESVDLSVDAGGYVCNHVFFMAMHLAATQLPCSRCGFAHLPAVDASSSRLARFVGIVRAWIASGLRSEATDAVQAFR